MINIYNIIGIFVFVAMGSGILYLIANIVSGEAKAQASKCILITLAIAALGYFLTLFGSNGAMLSIPVMLVASLVLIKYLIDVVWQRAFMIWIASIIANAAVLALIYLVAKVSGMGFAYAIL